MTDVLRGYHLMLDLYNWWNRSFVQDLKRKPHQVLTIALREKRDAADQSRSRHAQLRPRLRCSAQSHGGAEFQPSVLFEGSDGSHYRLVVDAGDQSSAAWTEAKVLPHHPERGRQFAGRAQVLNAGEAGHGFADGGFHPGKAQMGQGTGDILFKQQQVVGPPLPVLPRPLQERSPRRPRFWPAFD